MLVVVAFVVAHGRWPRSTRDDLARLAVLQAVIWLVIPIAGVIYFYRPFAANYLMASCIQLGLVACYRLELARADSGPRYWLAPIALAWGVIAGMANEHTGPTAIVAVLALTTWAWRRHRLRAWMIAGLAGLATGFAMLLFAPGQAVRYAGVASAPNPVHTLMQHGVTGNLKYVGDYVVEIAPGALLVLAAVAVAIKRRVELAATFDRALAVRAGLVLVAAIGIVGTAFASPIVEDRVFFAPCLLTAVALAMVAEIAWDEPVANRRLVIAAAAVIALDATGFVIVYRDVAARTDVRVEALASAPAGAAVDVPLVGELGHDHWTYGEDFAYWYMREFVAHHVYEVDTIGLADPPSWSQPRPPEHVHVVFDYDPPLPDAAPPADSPLASHVPAQAPWALRELREAGWRSPACPATSCDRSTSRSTPADAGCPATARSISRHGAPARSCG